VAVLELKFSQYGRRRQLESVFSSPDFTLGGCIEPIPDRYKFQSR